MLVAVQHPDYAPRNRGHIQDIKREEHHCIVDANGNSRLVTVTNRWQVLNIGGQLFTKCLERSIFQRDIVNPFSHPFNAHPATVFSPPAAAGSVLALHMPPGTRALPDMSVVIHHANALIPNALALVVQRPELADNPMIRLIDMVVRAVQLGVTGEAVLSGDVRQERADGHSAPHSRFTHLLQPQLISELLADTIESLLDGRPNDVQKAQDQSRPEKLWSLAGNSVISPVDVDLLQSLDALCHQYLVAGGNQYQQQQHPQSSLKPGETTVRIEYSGRSGQVKPLPPTGSSEHPLNRSDTLAPGEKSSDHGAARPEQGNRVVSQSNGIAMVANQGISALLNQSSNTQGSSLFAVMQPPPPMESGQKPLPPIVLPNTNPGSGSRSDRRKSKKELEEEEEKEREGDGRSFIFDEDSLEQFDDE